MPAERRFGDAASVVSTGSGMSRKSITFDSYMSTKPTATVVVAASLRPSEREIEISMSSEYRAVEPGTRAL